MSACSRNQVTSLEPPRNAAPFRSPSPQPHRDSGAASAASHPETEPEATIDAGPTTSKFDFYVLALSWAPQFCASHENERQRMRSVATLRVRRPRAVAAEQRRYLSRKLHGRKSRHLRRNSPDTALMPARGLIQHEWAIHGTCSGLAPREYFSLIQRAFGDLKVPAEYQHPEQAIQASPNEIEQKFASANGAPADAFRVSCSKRELIGVDVCLTKDLQYRSCGDAVRECHARQVSVPEPDTPLINAVGASAIS